MNTNLNVFERQSFKYVGTYKHLDEHKFVGSVRLSPARLVREPSDETAYYDDGTYLAHVRAPAELRGLNISRALAHTLSREGCAHEYDCCGCQSVSARARKVGPRDYVVTYTATRNY